MNRPHKYRPVGGTYQWTEVGEKVLVWSPSGEFVEGRSCVITAHGSGMLINGKCSIGTDVVYVLFYATHGHELKDPSLRLLTRGLIKAKETQTILPGGKLNQNYRLSKFRTDTYDMVRKRVHMKMRVLPGDEVEYYPDPTARPIDLDIVTIRNRLLKRDPTLYEVIEDLHKNGWMYKEVHCSFCRGSKPAEPTVIAEKRWAF